MNWLKKANDRKLIESEIYKELESDGIRIAKMLNAYIRSIGRSSQ